MTTKPDRNVKRPYNLTTACGMPLGTAWWSDAELERMTKEAERDERRRAKARARREALRLTPGKGR